MRYTYILVDKYPFVKIFKNISRLLTKLSESNVLDEVQEKLVLQAIKEGYIIDLYIVS